MHDVKLNVLRSWLINDGVSYVGENLYQSFVHMESQAYKTWIPALAHDKGSHSGSTHLKNVESQICNLLEQTPEVRLASWEAYILLSAILFHDLGRAISDLESKKLREQEGNTPKNKRIFVDHHAFDSYLFIRAHHNDLGLALDMGIVESIAYVCGAHCADLARKLRLEGCLSEVFLDSFGRIRVGWMGCLLSIGDELDNSYHRAMPDWVRYLQKWYNKFGQ